MASAPSSGRGSPGLAERARTLVYRAGKKAAGYVPPIRRLRDQRDALAATVESLREAAPAAGDRQVATRPAPPAAKAAPVADEPQAATRSARSPATPVAGGPKRAAGHTLSSRSSAQAWTCNICGSPSRVPVTEIERESPSCTACGSTLRWRAVVAALSVGLFGQSLTLEDFPCAPHLRGLGMSDWDGYARPLAERLGYENTYLHQEPALNIMEPVPEHLAGTCDFVISSDVLEHVDPPWARALEHFREMLVPGGLLVLTVPSKLEGLTEEHYPDLHDYKVVELAEGRVLVNRTRGGSLQVFDDLVFHGGDGSTLELRLFSTAHLVETLKELGYQAAVWADPIPEHGVVWNTPWSTPIVARAPAGRP